MQLIELEFFSRSGQFYERKRLQSSAQTHREIVSEVLSWAPCYWLDGPWFGPILLRTPELPGYAPVLLMPKQVVPASAKVDRPEMGKLFLELLAGHWPVDDLRSLSAYLSNCVGQMVDEGLIPWKDEAPSA